MNHNATVYPPWNDGYQLWRVEYAKVQGAFAYLYFIISHTFLSLCPICRNVYTVRVTHQTDPLPAGRQPLVVWAFRFGKRKASANSVCLLRHAEPIQGFRFLTPPTIPPVLQCVLLSVSFSLNPAANEGFLCFSPAEGPVSCGSWAFQFSPASPYAACYRSKPQEHTIL